jgi:transcriptional regulator with XRE-family HTH domain
VITTNMLVALNMARWRQASGMTQDQLGERLGGWTKTAVSAAERSWDGKRVRQFDADLIVTLARIFGVPVSAMFMPPEDDGNAFHYKMDAGGEVLPISNFFASYVGDAISDCAGGTAAGQAYAEAFVAALARYGKSELADVIGTRIAGQVAGARLKHQFRVAHFAGRDLASFRHAIDGIAETNNLLRDLLLARMRETPEGRGQLAELDQDGRRWDWADVVATESTSEQEKYLALARELFGAPGPASDEDLARLREEGKKRGLRALLWTRRRFLDGREELVVPPDRSLRREAGNNGNEALPAVQLP